MLLLRLLLPISVALAADAATYQKEYKKLETANDWAGAKEHLTKALKEFPDDAWLNVFMGYTLMNLKKPAEALPYYEKAYARAPNDKAVAANYAAGLSDQATDLFFKQHKFADACPLFQKATLVVPEEAGHYNSLGNCWRETRHFKESYDAFKTFYVLKPELAAQAGYKENFRIGVLAGVDALKGAGDMATAKAFAELGAKAYPHDKEIADKLNLVKGATGDAAGIADPVEKALAEGLALLGQDKVGEADAKFKTASSQAKDHTVDVRIQKAYRAKVEALPYDKQMASPLQDKVVLYAASSVKAYFKKNPYKQATSFYPPLGGKFCVGQGAGGKSFHYGLERNYSWDLVACDGGDLMGKPVLATADGTVIGVAMDNADNAKNAPVSLSAQPNIIRIQHGQTESQYYHLQKGSATVRVGDKVKKGQQIAAVGNSGVTTGPHLHFMVMKLNQELTLPVTFSGLYAGPKTAKAGAKLSAAKTLETAPVYSSAAKL